MPCAVSRRARMTCRARPGHPARSLCVRCPGAQSLFFQEAVTSRWPIYVSSLSSIMPVRCARIPMPARGKKHAPPTRPDTLTQHLTFVDLGSLSYKARPDHTSWHLVTGALVLIECPSLGHC